MTDVVENTRRQETSDALREQIDSRADVARIDRVPERGALVVDLGGVAEPARVGEVHASTPAPVEHPIDMASTDQVGFAAGFEFPGGERTNRGQQAVAGTACGERGLHHRLVDQRGQLGTDRTGDHTIVGSHRRGGVGTEATVEHGDPTQHRSGAGIQEVGAPPDGGVQSAVTFDATSFATIDAAVEQAGHQLRDPISVDSGGGQFDRQRQAVELGTEGLDVDQILIAGRERGVAQTSPVEEQSCRSRDGPIVRSRGGTQ